MKTSLDNAKKMIKSSNGGYNYYNKILIETTPDAKKNREFMSEKKPLKAVSLKYPDELPLPFISSSGKNEVAQKILEVAKENNIPIVENKELTDFLCASEIGSMIPENTWKAVASIFAFLVDLEKK